MSQSNRLFSYCNHVGNTAHPRPPRKNCHTIACTRDVLTIGLSFAEERYFEQFSARRSEDIWFANNILTPSTSNCDIIFTVWQVKKLINSLDYEREPTLLVSQLAIVLGLSRCYFTRVFKKSFGVTPAVFLKEWRIEKALWLVSNTHVKLTDIAAFCGFSDQAHFCRTFKQKVGMNPSLWRNANSNRASSINILTTYSNYPKSKDAPPLKAPDYRTCNPEVAPRHMLHQ